jgi:alpha-galactosidase
MDFKEANLKAIIRSAKKLNLEMFVLDDGWFGRRTDDTKGLGDYNVNKKKLSQGLKGIAKYANNNGLQFGLWFEPEMVNEDSLLFEEHPDWAIKADIRDASYGRNQLVLDLSRKEVQDYIIENVNHILDTNNITYVKWDMNRHISDVSSTLYHAGEVPHRYMIGLYRVLKEIIYTHPDVFFEGCASGGNRFDLGMLSYFDQIWTSDDTDAIERISIQSGYGLAYPLRCLSNHVSASPSHSVLRNTPLETRFNVALFGSLGYELDLSTLKGLEKKEIKEQIKFYKEHRKLIKDGTFYQLKDIKEDGYALWLVVAKDKSEAILGYYNGLQKMNPTIDEIKLYGLLEDKYYEFEVRHQEHNLHTFGGLVNQILPFKIDERGFIINTVSKFITLPGEKESYVLSGSALMNGALKLNSQWMGTGFNDSVRVLGDFGSRLYYIKVKE